MTVQPETTSTPAPSGAVKAGQVLGHAGFKVGLTAALSWASGVALHHGYHVSAPFMATWMLSMVGLLGANHIAHSVAHAWHSERAEVAPKIAADTKATEVLTEDAAKDYLAARKAGLVK
jgi:hypothetical protein